MQHDAWNKTYNITLQESFLEEHIGNEWGS